MSTSWHAVCGEKKTNCKVCSIKNNNSWDLWYKVLTLPSLVLHGVMWLKLFFKCQPCRVRLFHMVSGVSSNILAESCHRLVSSTECAWSTSVNYRECNGQVQNTRNVLDGANLSFLLFASGTDHKPSECSCIVFPLPPETNRTCRRSSSRN